ncbi:CPBP family intramembrane glutamic endopeptidase [Luteococcus sp. H138]|uniref:CPBP family intramembrane glutamic endopeptidase n=1 Tax=unclassified Luteococcus TaxID=2639923 RepID=UPI00313D5966
MLGRDERHISTAHLPDLGDRLDTEVALGRRSAPDQPPHTGGRWWHDPANPLLRALLFVLVLAVAALGTVPFETDGRAPDHVYLLAQLVGSIVGYLVVVLLLEGRRPPVELAPHRAGGLLIGLALGAGCCLLVFLVCLAGGWRTISGTNPDAPMLMPLLQLGVVASVSEEIIFRGLLFRLVEAGLGTWGAVLVSALVFGAVHLSNPQASWWGAVAIALEAGVMFALLYALTRSLWLVIGVHAAWNVLQGPVLGSAVSGATANGDGLLITQPAGPELLSGGVFGLEASLVSVVVWLAASGWLVRRLLVRRLVVAPSWRRHWVL